MPDSPLELFSIRVLLMVDAGRGLSRVSPVARRNDPHHTKKMSIMTITTLLGNIKNHSDAITALLAEPLQTEKTFVWMIDATSEDQLVTKARHIAQHAERIIRINSAIHAVADGKTVTQDNLGDFKIS